MNISQTPVAKNILFIVADDLNAWIGSLGRHPDVKTPAIDRLASRGTLFTRAYCAAPYCNASRMSVFTSCLPSTTGVYQNEPFWDTPVRRQTALEVLANSDYFLFGAGKVFHGHFDYAKAGREQSRVAQWRDVENRRGLWDVFHSNETEPLPVGRPLNGMFDFGKFDQVSSWNHHFDWGELPDDRVAEMPDSKTVDAIIDQINKPITGPTLFAVGLYKPHLPWYVPKRFRDLYPIDKISLPVVRADDLDDVPTIAKKWALSPDDHQGIIANDQWRPAVQGYLSAISYCDYQIGLILDALEKSERAKDTVVVLWGDNGFHLGEKLHWRKFVLWEEATRVPLIISTPDHSFAPRVNDPVSLIDIWPTLLDLVGAKPMAEVDGKSLTPLMRGEICDRPVFTTWLRDNHSLRYGQWRYTRYSDASEELYDHVSDPYEWTNRAADPNFSSDLAAIRQIFDRQFPAG